MFPIQAFALDLSILIVIFSAFVIGTVRWKPRIWLHDFPSDIQAMAAPKTAEEKRLTALVGTPLVIVFIGLPILLAWDLKSILGVNFSFLSAWLYTYSLFFGVNLWDLVILDWIGFTLVDPQHPPFSGTEGAAGWRNYAFHFHGFLKGCIMGIVFAALQAGVIMLLA
jgi:hypothetical protein